MTVLLTGFEPFHTHTKNPSGDLALALADSDGITAHVLPVAYEAAGAQILDLIREHAPDAVLMFGLADSEYSPVKEPWWCQTRRKGKGIHN